jgi:hypothetical protein
VRLKRIRDFVAEMELNWSQEGAERPKSRKPNFEAEGVPLIEIQGAVLWAVEELKKLLNSKKRLTEAQRERVWFLYGVAQTSHWVCVPRVRCAGPLSRIAPSAAIFARQ